MPAFFVKTTDKGVVVSNKPLLSKEITLKGGGTKIMPVQTEGIKFGFFGWENPSELDYEKGDVLPVSLSASPVKNQEGEVLNIFWCNPD